MLDAAGLLGRGGAGFPVGRTWASVMAVDTCPVLALRLVARRPCDHGTGGQHVGGERPGGERPGRRGSGGWSRQAVGEPVTGQGG